MAATTPYTEFGGEKGSGGKLIPPDRLAGTWRGNGCCLTPACLRVTVEPACGGGLCVYRYCGSCTIPFQCQYMVPCGNRCYTDCDDEGWWPVDDNTIDMKCGAGMVRGPGSGQVGSAAMYR